MSRLLGQGFDTLVFSTSKFYLNNPDFFSLMKKEAGEEKDKLKGFSYSFDSSVVIDGEVVEVNGHSEFLMRSTSFNPFAWSMYDIDKLFLFNIVYVENKKIFQVKVLAEAFLKYKSFTVLKKVLQEKVGCFGVDLEEMKVKRLDYAVDIEYSKKKIDIWTRKGGFLETGLVSYRSCLLRPAQKNFYVKDYGKEVGNRVTGFYVGSKNVLLRVYDKVLESIEKYDENRRKSETILESYYKKNELRDQQFSCDVSKRTVDIQYWNMLLKEEYLNDSLQVVRFEYQFKGDYLEGKFPTVADLDVEGVKALVKFSFTHHSGFAPKNYKLVQEDFKNCKRKYERDVQFYLDCLESGGTFSIVKRLAADVDNCINRNIRTIFSTLAKLGENMSLKKGEIVDFSQIKQYMATFERYFDVILGERLWDNTKVLFSLKQYRNGILDFIEYDDFKEEYNFAL